MSEIPQEFLEEQKRRITVALVDLNDSSKDPESSNRYVVIKHDDDEAKRCPQQVAADAPADKLQQAATKTADPPHVPGALVCTTIRAVSPIAGTDETGTKLRWRALTVEQVVRIISNLEERAEDTKARTTRCDALGVSKRVVGKGDNSFEVCFADAVLRKGKHFHESR